MHIAQVIDNLIIGGAQKWLVTFVQAAQAQSDVGETEYTVTIISLAREHSASLKLELESFGANIEIFPFERVANIKQLFLLYRFIKLANFDIIQTHLIRANIVGAVIGRMTQTPSVATLHSTGEAAHRFNPLRMKVEAFVLRFVVQRVLAIGSSVVAAYSGRLGDASLEIIPNAVSPIPPISISERARIRQEILKDAGRPFLISVGRVSSSKGYGDLLLALEILSQTHPEVGLAIVGTGRLYDEISHQILHLGLCDHVIMLGVRDDVPQLLAAADIYVSSSHREGLPLAILEAMAASLPVVATNVGDIQQIINPDRGIVVPPHQPAEIARALAQLLDQPELQKSLADTGKAYILENHHPTAWINRLLLLFSDVISNYRNPFSGVIRKERH